MSDELRKWLNSDLPKWQQRLLELSKNNEDSHDILDFEDLYRIDRDHKNSAIDLPDLIWLISQKMPTVKFREETTTVSFKEESEILGYKNGGTISQALLDFKGAYAAYTYQDASNPGLTPGPEWTLDQNGAWNDEVEGTKTDTGLKVTSFIKHDGNNVEVMIAFAGTEDLKDAAADINYGITQYKANRERLMSYIDSMIKKYPNAKFHFTGHSLGEGPTQYLSYDYAKTYLKGKPENRRPPDTLTVTTFNGFGAEYGIKAIFNEEMDLSLFKNVKIQCFFAFNDLVSRLGGRHIGPTFGLALDVDCWLESHRLRDLFYHHIRQSGLEDRVDSQGRLLPGVKADQIPYFNETTAAKLLSLVNIANFNFEHGKVESTTRLIAALLLFLITKPPTKDLKALCDFLAKNTEEAWDEISAGIDQKLRNLDKYQRLINLASDLGLDFGLDLARDLDELKKADNQKRKELIVKLLHDLPERFSGIDLKWKVFTGLLAKDLIILAFIFDVGESLLPIIVNYYTISSEIFRLFAEKIVDLSKAAIEETASVLYTELEIAIDKLNDFKDQLLDEYQTKKEELAAFERQCEVVAIFFGLVTSIAIAMKIDETIGTLVSAKNEVINQWENLVTKLNTFEDKLFEQLTVEMIWDTVAALKYGSMLYNSCASFYQEVTTDLTSAQQGIIEYASEFSGFVYNFLSTPTPPLGEGINEVVEIDFNQLFKDKKIMKELGFGQKFDDLYHVFQSIQPDLRKINHRDTIIMWNSRIFDLVNYEINVQPVLNVLTKMSEQVDVILKEIDDQLADKNLTESKRQNLLTLKKHFQKKSKDLMYGMTLLEKKEIDDDDDDGNDDGNDEGGGGDDDGGGGPPLPGIGTPSKKKKDSPPPPPPPGGASVPIPILRRDDDDDHHDDDPPPGGGGGGVPVDPNPSPKKKQDPPPPPRKPGAGVPIPLDIIPAAVMDDGGEALPDFINIRNSLQNISQGLDEITRTAPTSQTTITQLAHNLLEKGFQLLKNGVPDDRSVLIQDWQTLQNQTTVLLQQLNETIELSANTQTTLIFKRIKENVLLLSKATGRIMKQLRQNIVSQLTPEKPVPTGASENRAQMVDLLGPSSKLSNPGGVALEFATPVVQVEDYLRMQYPALLSLKRLGLNLSHYPEPAERPFELTYPASLDRIYGMVVDQAADEIYLLGDTARKGKGIQADDLIVALQAICLEKVSPAVSLDPEPGKPAGPQWSRIDGCPPDSAFARQMLDADYEMKRIQTGALTTAIPEELSSYARLVQASHDLPNGSNNRFWLCPFLPYVLKIDIEVGLTLFLFNIMVRVKTQNMVDAGRMTKASGGLDPLAEQAALSFSDHYSELEHHVAIGNNYLIFHQLRRLFDLTAVSAIINNYYPETQVPRILGSLPITPLGELAKAPLYYEGIHREVFSGDARIIVISGGVDLSLRFRAPKSWTLQDSNLNAIRKGILQLRQSQTIAARIAPLHIDTSSIGSCAIDDPITIAQTLVAACKAKQAHEVLVKAIEADPAFVEAQAYLAVVNWKMGDYDSSRIALEKALTQNPDNPFVRSVNKQFNHGLLP